MIQIASAAQHPNVAEELRIEVEMLDFNLDGSGAEMAFPPSSELPPESFMEPFPLIYEMVMEIAYHRQLQPIHMMINRLKPGVIVPKHRDWLRNQPKDIVKIERWHLPVATNGRCWWWDESMGECRWIMPAGSWHGPVPFWLQHQVGNEGTTDRIHLIVDLQAKEEVGRYAEAPAR